MVGGGKAQAEEVAEERHRGLHAHKGLAIECEDGQEENGIGLKVQGLDLVMGEDGVEEWRERWDQPVIRLCRIYFFKHFCSCFGP